MASLPYCEEKVAHRELKSRARPNACQSTVAAPSEKEENCQNSSIGGNRSIVEFHGQSPGNNSPGMQPSTRRHSTNSFEEIKLNFVGRFYRKIKTCSRTMRYAIYIFPVALLLGIPILILGLKGPEYVRMGHDEDDRGHHIKGPHLLYFMIWIEAMWLAFWVIKLFAWALPYMFKFFAGAVSTGVRKYVVVLENLVRPMSFMLWSLIMWLTYLELMIYIEHTPDVPWVVVLRKIFAAIFVSSLVLLVEKTVVQIIAVGYHQRSFANRIKASKRQVHLLDILYSTSRLLFPMYCVEFADEDSAIKPYGDVKLGTRSNSTSAPLSTGPSKITNHVSHIGDKVSSALGNFTSEMANRATFKQNSIHSTVINALEKQSSSEALARRIFHSLVRQGNTSIAPNDFVEILVDNSRKDALDAFEMFDKDRNGDISIEEMTNKVVDIAEERKAISGGMKNIGDALKALDKVLLVVVAVLTVFIFVAFFKKSVIAVLAAAGTAVLSLSFAFAATAQEFLGSCIFLFIKHPYDVGDRVDINRSWAVIEQLVVEEISLLYTVFRSTESMKIVQVPNIQLNDGWVDNLSRSEAMVEQLNVDVAFETSFEDIERLRQEMETFVQAPENCRDFQPDFNIGCGGVGNLDKMTLHISIKHKSNWHNEAVRVRRRSKFMTAFSTAIKTVPIYPPGGGIEPLGGHLNPTYTVAVTDDFASYQRQQASKKKE